MLDASACCSTRRVSEPVAALSALVALRSLLSEAMRTAAAPPEAAVESPPPHPGGAMPHHRRSQALERQADFFSAPRPNSSTLRWSSLPKSTQQTVTALITRLLVTTRRSGTTARGHRR